MGWYLFLNDDDQAETPLSIPTKTTTELQPQAREIEVFEEDQWSKVILVWSAH